MHLAVVTFGVAQRSIMGQNEVTPTYCMSACFSMLKYVVMSEEKDCFFCLIVFSFGLFVSSILSLSPSTTEAEK